jgi:hypothetical protein
MKLQIDMLTLKAYKFFIFQIKNKCHSATGNKKVFIKTEEKK